MNQIENQLRKILGKEPEEGAQGPEKIETTLTNEEDAEKIKNIRMHIAEINQKLKEKFNYIYGQPEKPELEENEKEEFNILIREIEDASNELKRKTS